MVANLEGDVTGTIQTAAQTNITSLGTLTTLTVDDITINGSTISDSGALDITSGADFTIDSAADITLDADGGDFRFKDGGTTIATYSNVGGDWYITANSEDKDIVFQGNDGGSTVQALKLDMSERGNATFNGSVSAYANSDTVAGLDIYSDANHGLRILHRATEGDFSFERRVGGNNTEFLRIGRSTGDATFAGNINLADSKKVIFGADSDLQIYHDASNSYIDDAGTGGLSIRSNLLQIGKYTGELSALFVADGESNLYYDNSKKIATTSTGIDVTGTVTSDGLTVDGFITGQNAPNGATVLTLNDATGSAVNQIINIDLAKGGGAYNAFTLK